MVSCYDCIHYEHCKEVFLTDKTCWADDCKDFKNKADVVKVKHGKWVEGKSLEKCSLCGKKGFSDWIYCPRCGAKMDGKEVN